MLTFSKGLIPLVLLVVVCYETTAQVDPPMDPTVWQKLGVRNSIRRFQKKRDSRINRKGNRPQAEKKPELLKLSDPKLLKPPEFANAEMLKVAAEAKIDADLAPQKIKAVKYLASLGCGCNAKVGPALLAALKDCHPDVRTAAVNAIMTTAQRADECKGKKRFSLGKLGKKGKGGAASSCGCGGAPACGCCDFATSCTVCGTCCSPEIQEKLKEMATGQYDNGCFKEPVDSIRQLAQQTLDMCPPPGDFDDPTKKDKPKTGVEGENKKDEETPKKDGDDQISYRLYDNPVSPKARTISAPSKGQSISASDLQNMIKGLLTDSIGSSQATIKFGESLKIPNGTKLTLLNEQGTIQDVVVIGSSVGQVQIQTLGQAPLQFESSKRIWVGIQAN